MKHLIEILVAFCVAALFAMPQTHIPSAATDPAAITSVVDQSAADVSSDEHSFVASTIANGEGPRGLDSTVLPQSPAQPAPVYRVARPTPTRQYSSCGPGGCAPSGPIRRLFGRR